MQFHPIAGNYPFPSSPLYFPILSLYFAHKFTVERFPIEIQFAPRDPLPTFRLCFISQNISTLDNGEPSKPRLIKVQIITENRGKVRASAHAFAAIPLRRENRGFFALVRMGNTH